MSRNKIFKHRLKIGAVASLSSALIPISGFTGIIPAYAAFASDEDSEEAYINRIISDLQGGKSELTSESVHDVNELDTQAGGYWIAVKKDSGLLYYFYSKKPMVSQIKSDYNAGKFVSSSAVSTIGQLKADDKIYLIEGSDLDSYVVNTEEPTIQNSNIILRNKIVFLKDAEQLKNNDNLGEEELVIDDVESRYYPVYDILQNNSFLYYVGNGFVSTSWEFYPDGDFGSYNFGSSSGVDKSSYVLASTIEPTFYNLVSSVDGKSIDELLPNERNGIALYLNGERKTVSNIGLKWLDGAPDYVADGADYKGDKDYKYKLKYTFDDGSTYEPDDEYTLTVAYNYIPKDLQDNLDNDNAEDDLKDDGNADFEVDFRRYMDINIKSGDSASRNNMGNQISNWLDRSGVADQESVNTYFEIASSFAVNGFEDIAIGSPEAHITMKEIALTENSVTQSDGSVRVVYKNTDGNVISEDYIDTPLTKISDPAQSYDADEVREDGSKEKPLTIQGNDGKNYHFVHSNGKETGVLSEGETVVEYTYAPEEYETENLESFGNVIIKYETEDGRELKVPVTDTDNAKVTKTVITKKYYMNGNEKIYVENGESRETENLSPTYNAAEDGEKPEYIDDELTGKRYYLIGVSGNETGNVVEGDTVVTYKYALRNEETGGGFNNPGGGDNTPDAGDNNTPDTGDNNTPDAGDNNTPDAGDNNTPDTGDNNTPDTGDNNTTDGSNSDIALKNGEAVHVNEAPKTGDESKKGLFAGILGISASIASIAFLKLRKKKTFDN